MQLSLKDSWIIMDVWDQLCKIHQINNGFHLWTQEHFLWHIFSSLFFSTLFWIIANKGGRPLLICLLVWVWATSSENSRKKAIFWLNILARWRERNFDINLGGRVLWRLCQPLQLQLLPDGEEVVQAVLLHLEWRINELEKMYSSPSR